MTTLGDSALGPAGQPGRGEPRGVKSVLGWAVYLGCSWTWCIGMFFPVFLVRDYGLWGFVVFAVPNVIGAGAMGWTLRDAGASTRFVERNREAVYLFTVITIAFHAFWLTWLATWILENTGQGYAVIAPALVAALVLAGALNKDNPARARIAAAVVWGISILVLVALLATLKNDAISPQSSLFFPTSDSAWINLLAMAPVSVFGFALCPYLDATFHRARRGTSRAGGRAAFTIGFGIIFAAMIVLTLVYAGPFIAKFDSDLSTVPAWAMWAAAAVLLHIAVQLVFTVRVHQHASAELESEIIPLLPRLGRALPLAAALLAMVSIYQPTLLGMTSGELVYRGFMSTYGLLLPAYVWICAIPTRDGHSGIHGTRGRAKLRVLVVAALIAAPMYFVGDIMRYTIWMLPGVAVLLLARVPVMVLAGKRSE